MHVLDHGVGGDRDVAVRDGVIVAVGPGAGVAAAEPGAKSADKRSAADVQMIVEGLKTTGKKVILVDQENAANLGGQAFWSFGGLFFVDSPQQRRMGIRDSYELALQDWMGTAAFDRDEDYWPRQWAQAYVEFAAGEKHAWLAERGKRCPGYEQNCLVDLYRARLADMAGNEKRVVPYSASVPPHQLREAAAVYLPVTMAPEPSR